MAMIDNVDFLVLHIRNSFITSDDTGMCELIIENDDLDRNDRRQTGQLGDGDWQQHYQSKGTQQGNSDSGMESSDCELSSSMDIYPDMDYGHRRRSNTAQRLDRLKKEKRNQGKMKKIVWKNPPSSLSKEEKNHLFEGRELESGNAEDYVPVTHSSLLSLQLLTNSFEGDNPFREYARFDGSSSIGMATKRIEIFLTMSPTEQRCIPMLVVVLSTAKVQDLIGLICWQYTKENRQPKLHDWVEMYCLHIAEDDGEVDADFPSLDNREPVSKFGFAKLALVAREEGSVVLRSSSIIVTVNVPNRGFNKIQVANSSITMREIMEKVLKKRRIQLRPGISYKLEKQNEPGVIVDLDQTLASQDVLEFCLIRENSARGDIDEMDRRSSVNDVAESLTSHQYKSYVVSMVHRLRANSDVQLGISGEKVEIDPVLGKGTSRLFRQRPVSYDADSLVDSCVLEVHRSSGKAVFRITHLSGNEYKHNTFEADQDITNEIVQKVNNIMEMRLSLARKDFVHSQERKVKKRDSIRYS